MARLNPSLSRKTGVKKQNLGKMIIFCEGQTEHNYIEHFANIINSNDNKYSHIEIKIEDVIKEMLHSDFSYKLLLTNLLFETWLLMHLEEVDKDLNKAGVMGRLKNSLKPDEYDKNSKGIIRKITGNGYNIIRAIENAKKLEEIYNKNNLDYTKDIKKMNPYTTVNKLIERIIQEIC